MKSEYLTKYKGQQMTVVVKTSIPGWTPTKEGDPYSFLTPMFSTWAPSYANNTLIGMLTDVVGDVIYLEVSGLEYVIDADEVSYVIVSKEAK